MSNFNVLFSGAGGGGGLVRQLRIMNSSGSYTAPVAGKLLIMSVAPGGSGGALASASGTQRLATGGGAGEILFDYVDVNVNDSFTVLMGTPGASVSTTGTANGNAGGTVTITGPNSYSVVVNGGLGGLAATSVATLAGGAGGSGGSGGTAKAFRYQGGRGGNISAAASSIAIATGGGAVNPMGLAAQTATRGGDSSSTATSGNIATGGGGAGGRGGDVTSATFNTGGGGAGGNAATNATTAGPNIVGVTAGVGVAAPTDVSTLLSNFGISYFGSGLGGGQTSVSPDGGGTGGRNVASGVGGNAGNFGGSGGCSVGTNNTTGSSIIGGGSGGSVQSGGGTAVSGAGGGGIVVFMLIETLQ